jgi:hypothetical protein
MPIYEIQGPDGRLYEIEGPEGATREQIIQAVLANMPQPTPEPTLGGQVKEFVKGIPAGFVGTFGTAAEGAAALLPERAEQAVVGAVRRGVSALTPEAAPGYEDTVGRKLGQAVGSVGSFIVPGGAATLGARALGAGAAGQTAARLGTVGVLGGAAGAGEARQRAEVEGATPEEKSTATALGVLPGLLEIIPAQYLLNRVFKPASEIAKNSPQIVQRLKDIAKTAGIEGAQEAAQEFAQNLIAQGVYKPEQELIEGIGESAAYGAGAGAIVEALMQMAIGRKASRFRDEVEKKAREEAAEAKRLGVDQEEAARLGAPLFTREEAQRGIFETEEGEAAPFSPIETEDQRAAREAESTQVAQEMQREYAVLKAERERLQQEAADAADNDDFEGARRAAEQFSQIDSAVKELEKQAKAQKISLAPQAAASLEDIESKIKRAKADLKKAATLGEADKVVRLGQKVRDLEAQAVASTPDLFSPENVKRTFDSNFAPFAERQELLAQSIQRPSMAENEQDRQIQTFFQQMQDLQEQSRQLKQERELNENQIAEAQARALNRIEFGLERLGLTSLGLTGAPRKKAETQINYGLVDPTVANLLEIVPSDLDAQIVRAKRAKDAATVKRLEAQKIQARTQASAVLPQIEQAYDKVEQRRKDLLFKYLNGEVEFLNAQGELTTEGKQAVQDEAKLRELGILRLVGRQQEGEPTAAVEGRRRAEQTELDLESAPGAEALGRVVEQQTAPLEEAPDTETAERRTPYTSRNDAFLSLSDAAYALQRGQFLGRRTAAQGVPSFEQERAEKIEKQISGVQKELETLRTAQKKAGRQPSEERQRRITQLEGRLKTLRAGLTNLTAEGRSLYSSLVRQAEDAANFMVDNAIKEVQADRLARGLGQMTPTEARNLETRLRIETGRFIDRVSAAERTTGEVEEVPTTRMVDGRRVPTTITRQKRPPVERRPYEKLGTALQTLRNEIESTITEAKGLPQRGEVEAEPVERVAKPVEKPVKTTKKKIAERQREIKKETKKQQAVTLGKQVVSDNQKKMQGLQKQLQLTGSEIGRLKKAAVKDKNPQLRMAKIERLEENMATMRTQLRELRNTNAALAAALRTLGVETSRMQSGAYLLQMIENDQYLTKEELSESGTAQTNIDRIDQLQKLKRRQQTALDEKQQERDAVKRRLDLLTLFPALNTTMQRSQLRKQLEVQERLLSQAKSEVNKTQRDIAAVLKAGTGKQTKQGVTTARFTPYQVDLAAKFLQSRIDAVQERLAKSEKTSSETDKLLKAKLGTITTPEGKTLPGTRVITEMQPGLVARPADIVKAERDFFDEQIAAATATRDVIKEQLQKEGKPIGSNKEWKDANAKVMRLTRSKNAVAEFERGSIPVRVKQEIFATDADTQEVVGPRARKTADFVKDKPLDAEEIAADVKALLKDRVVAAEKALDMVDPKDATKMRAAKAALTRARNEYSKAVVYKVRSELNEKDLLEGTDRNEFAIETDFDAGAATDADIIDSITYKDDTIDFAIGEEATELVDSDAANKRLADVKKKAKAQGIDFEYYDAIENLPIGILKQMAKEGMDTSASQVRGGVHKGKVFVVVQNHNNLRDLERTLAHELVGHYAFEGMLGKDGMDNLLTRVNKSFDNVFELAKELGVYEDAMAAFVQGRNYGLDGRQAQVKALREVVAYTMEKRVDQNFMQKAKRWLQEMVGAMRNALRKLGLVDSSTLTTSDLFYLMRKANQAFESGKAIASKNSDGTISFATVKPVYKPGYDIFGQVGDKVIAPRKKNTDRVQGASVGMELRTKWFDNFAPVEEMLRRGVDKGIVDSVKAQNAVYFARMTNQRNTIVSEFASTGVGKIVEETQRTGTKAFMLKMVEGPNLKNVFEALRGAEEYVGNSEAVRQAASIYLVAVRSQRVGADVVQIKKQLRADLGRDVTQAELDAIVEQGNKIPQFVEFRKRYNEYNKALVNFLVQSGALSKELGNELTRTEDYVPYYRVDGDTVNLVMPKENPIRIGDIKNQPYLQELVGGDSLIVDVFTSSLRNTQLLADMALRNLATRNIAYTLQDMGAAKITKGDGSANSKTIRFKRDGEKYNAVIDTNAQEGLFDGIPAELLVQGLEGIKVTVPNVVKYMSVPTNFLKRMITLDPRYGLRQIARDSMQVALTSGANVTPIAEGMVEVGKIFTGKSQALKEVRAAGVLSGNVISGTPAEMQRRLEDIVFGRGNVATLLGKMEEFAMMGEASSKLSAYNSFKKQGLSDFEASIAAMETFNFTRRGLSPSAYYANMLIPFFNAGMQGLDLIYRAYKGQMPSEQQLKIKQKLLTRGFMIAGMTMAYALIMEDDEAYKNATPEQRYGNWFVRIPFMDEPLKVPIPFELGLIFKSVPEGITNAMFTDEKTSKIAKDLALQTLRSLPGGISEAGVPVPAALKPVIETALNRSFFTGRDIVDGRMADLDKRFQFRDKTPEALKIIGPILEQLNLSPIQVENLIRGYTGGLGIGLVSIVDPLLRTSEAGTVAGRVTDIPIVGGLFQPNDAGRVINEAYDSMKEVQSRQRTYKALIERGELKEAEQYLNRNLTQIGAASLSGTFRQRMGELTKIERSIRAAPPNVLNPQQKREKLDEIRKIKVDFAAQMVAARERIERQAAR